MIPRSLKKPLLFYKPVKRLFKRFTSQRTDKEFRNASFLKQMFKEGKEGREKQRREMKKKERK